jgi:hypothetical protein
MPEDIKLEVAERPEDDSGPVMTFMDEFKECDTCRGKLGTPTLCTGCIHNRSLIRELRSYVDEFIENDKQSKEQLYRAVVPNSSGNDRDSVIIVMGKESE